MWRIGLAVLGGFLGYKMAKAGKSRKNMVLFTLSGLAMYKLTEWSMNAKAKVRLANEISREQVPPVESA